MNTLSQEVGTSIAEAENEAIARFYDKVGLGNMYRAAVSAQGLKHVIAQFTKRGYETYRHTINTGVDGTLRYQMLLMHNGVEVASQDIEVVIEIGEMVEHGTQEADA